MSHRLFPTLLTLSLALHIAVLGSRATLAPVEVAVDAGRTVVRLTPAPASKLPDLTELLPPDRPVMEDFAPSLALPQTVPPQKILQQTAPSTVAVPVATIPLPQPNSTPERSRSRPAFQLNTPEFVEPVSAAELELFSTELPDVPESAAPRLTDTPVVPRTLPPPTIPVPTPQPITPTRPRTQPQMAEVAVAEFESVPVPAAETSSGAVDEFPRSLPTNPAPVYPPAALRNGVEGVVLITVTIASDGTAKSVTPAKSSGSQLLDEAALQAVRGWRFSPARRGKQAVEFTVNVPIRFRIRPSS